MPVRFRLSDFRFGIAFPAADFTALSRFVRARLSEECLIYKQSAARGMRKLRENRACGWSRQPLKIEPLHGRGLPGVVTLIPDENGSEDGLARGDASMYRVPGRVPWAPGAPHRRARGSPHGITSVPRFGLIYLPA
jgi:hypothetical protein